MRHMQTALFVFVFGLAAIAQQASTAQSQPIQKSRSAQDRSRELQQLQQQYKDVCQQMDQIVAQAKARGVKLSPKLLADFEQQKKKFKRQFSSVSKKPDDTREQVKNKRQEVQTSFENADQRTNQLMNILSTILKAMNEMRAVANSSMN